MGSAPVPGLFGFTLARLGHLEDLSLSIRGYGSLWRTWEQCRLPDQVSAASLGLQFKGGRWAAEGKTCGEALPDVMPMDLRTDQPGLSIVLSPHP